MIPLANVQKRLPATGVHLCLRPMQQTLAASRCSRCLTAAGWEALMGSASQKSLPEGAPCQAM